MRQPAMRLSKQERSVIREAVGEAFEGRTREQGIEVEPPSAYPMTGTACLLR